MAKYYEDFKLLNTPQEVISNCNSLTVLNTGTATAVLNGVEIIPGAQYVILPFKFYRCRNRTSFSNT